MHSMRYITFLYTVCSAHISPILHVQANNCLFRFRPFFLIFNRLDRRPWLTSKLFRFFCGPCFDTCIPTLHHEAEVEDIFDRLCEGIWIEEAIHRIHLGILVDKIPRLLLYQFLIVQILRQLRFIFTRPFYCILFIISSSTVQCFANDLDVLLHRAQFISITALLFSSLVHVFRLFLLCVLALCLLLRLLFVPFWLFAVLWRIFSIERAVEKGDIGRQGIVADAYLET
mmetsp:Transcript_36700/g.77440  ORF Transcript_36700/g.77440 Transcript_36700/m.77440 type:complete len:228 (-) Transcript_36700:604-1287(-)